MFFSPYDWTILIIIPGMILAAIASGLVSSTFSKYSKVRARSGISAAMLCKEILAREGIYDIQIVRVSGSLTDHYDHKNRRIALSETVYASSSVGALGVAAHECGHAIQYARNYAPVKIRAGLVPVINATSVLLWPVFIGGLILGFTNPETTIGRALFLIGLVLFGFSVLFSLVTLPTEFDASRRANAILLNIGALDKEESKGAKKVLRAAAFTYITALIMSLLNLLRIILIFTRKR